MKKLILVSLMFLSLESLYGQYFQVGVQAGADYKMISDYYSEQSRFSANKGIYLRHETKNGWAFEANASHTQFNYISSPIIWDCCWGCGEDNIAGRPYNDQLIHHKLDVFTVNTVAQHKITGKKSIISDYIGMNAGITRVYKKETTDYTFSDDPAANIYKRSAYDHTTDIHMGISNTLSIAVSKHFVVRNTISAYANPFTLFSRYPYKPEYNANTTFQCSFSVGYLFK